MHIRFTWKVDVWVSLGKETWKINGLHKLFALAEEKKNLPLHLSVFCFNSAQQAEMHYFSM